MKNYDLTKEVPYIHNRNELKSWLQPIYIIERYTVDEDTYTTFMAKLRNIIRGCFTIKACREYPIRFKFNEKDKDEYTLELRDFFINIILWHPFVELHGLNILNKDFILDCKTGIPNIEDYINYKLITVLREYHVKPTKINYSLSEVLYDLRNISIDFSIILGLNFSVKTYMDLYEKNDEFRDMMEVKFDESMQPHEIEEQLHEIQDRGMDIFKSDPNNPIGVILNAGTGIKNKQLVEFSFSEGLKPSIEGVTIPEPIENSTMLRGLDRPSYLYIDATGARKSLFGMIGDINLFKCWKLLLGLRYSQV